jgi:hypothetical protein
MTEQQREDELLSELLDLHEEDTHETQIIYGSAQQPLLTQHEEQALLKAANAIGTPTLAPDDYQPAHESGYGSFLSDLAGVLRKHPLLAVAAVGGLALVLSRRRSRR